MSHDILTAQKTTVNDRFEHISSSLSSHEALNILQCTMDPKSFCGVLDGSGQDSDIWAKCLSSACPRS